MSFFPCLPLNHKNILEQFAKMETSHKGASMNTSFHSSGKIDELASQDYSCSDKTELFAG